MAGTLALAPPQDPEAPLDAAAVRSRFERLSMSRRGEEEETEAAALAADAVRSLRSEYEVTDVGLVSTVALQAVDAWDSSAAALGSNGFDALIEKLKSSREVISAPSFGWLIRQFQHHIIINTLRRSLVKDANNSRHSFEYLDKDETIVAHLVGGIDAFIKISADWPLSSYGLKLISIRNSETQPANITLNLLCKTKELADGLELQTRRYLVRFVDAVEEILDREMQSGIHSG